MGRKIFTTMKKLLILISILTFSCAEKAKETPTPIKESVIELNARYWMDISVNGVNQGYIQGVHTYKMKTGEVFSVQCNYSSMNGNMTYLTVKQDGYIVIDSTCNCEIFYSLTIK
jgi:hypothetical protein